MQDNLEDIKRKKLEMLQKQYQEKFRQQAEEEQQAQQQVAELEEAIKARMNKDALMRYGNIKAANPERAIHTLVVLARLIEMGKIAKIDDNTLKSVLEKLDLGKRQTRIVRK